MPMNLMLWGSENWSGNKADVAMAEVFHHKSIRRTLGISMMQVKEQEIKNEEVRRRFGNIECMTNIWRRRQLLFIGRIVRLGYKKYPLILLTSTVDGKRGRGRPSRTIRDEFVDNLISI